MDIRTWEQRHDDIALCEINQEFESQRLEFYQANRWADQAPRERYDSFGESDMRNRIFQENRARDCQEIEELRRICCEETDRARQMRIDESSMRQERNPSSVSQLLTQIRDMQNTVNSLTDAREFYDPETASSSGMSHVPSQPLNISSPRGVLSRDSGLPLDTRNSMGTSGNVFESLPAREGPSSALFENSKNLASYSCGQEILWNMGKGEMRAAEFVNTNPRFLSRP